MGEVTDDDVTRSEGFNKEATLECILYSNASFYLQLRCMFLPLLFQHFFYFNFVMF